MTRPPLPRRIVRRDLLLLVLVAAVLYLPFLGARDLWNPNEPIYGRAVVELAERGEWLLPTVNGEPFAEKPILYFVLARLAGLTFGGVGEFTLRLPSALAGIAAVGMVYLLVLPYAGRRRAAIASTSFMTLYIVFWSARSIQMDLLLTATALAAILAATRVLDHGLSPWIGYPLAGAATGLAVLAKGPVGLVVVGLPVAGYVVATRRVGRLAHPAVLGGAAVCAAVAVPWFAWLGAAGEPGLLTDLLYRQNVVRSLDAWDHRAPWWYFLREFWNDMAPWSLFVPLAFGLKDRDPATRRLDTLAWVWLVVVIVFFSIPLSKRSPYILPLAPAVAVVASGLAERLLAGTLGRGRRRAVLAVCGFFAVLFLGAGGWIVLSGVDRFPEVGPAGAVVGGVLLIAAAAIGVALAARRARALAPVALYASVFAVYVAAAALVLPALDARKSARPFCERVAALVGERPLRSYGMWRWRAGYVYYLDRTIPRLDTADDLKAYWRSSGPSFLLVEEGKQQDVLDVLGDIAPVLRAEIGSKTVFLYGSGVRSSPE